MLDYFRHEGLVSYFYQQVLRAGFVFEAFTLFSSSYLVIERYGCSSTGRAPPFARLLFDGASTRVSSMYFLFF